jgi:NADH-quinone oxidoreductase subunit L
MDKTLCIIVLAPLVGFLINGLFGKRFPEKVVGTIAFLGPAISFVFSVLAFEKVVNGGLPIQTLWTWMVAGDVSINFGFQVDQLSGIMILVVTGVGSLIHLYSIGYMHKDDSFWRFFAYLNLFMSSMLLLVLGDNLVVLFVGWEGVGLCSYLLIGYYYKDLANSDAGNKAFITNRIGDFGFLLGMFALFSVAGTLDFSELSAKFDANQLVVGGPFTGWTLHAVLTFAGICLFVGACGKSAQIPLYVWLPDAMAGPTPVSALIHAATMVTAGIYMVARMNFLYVQIPDVMAGMALIAATTALLAGIIAVAQNDIKKILAYSTISQLGYMFCGVASTAFTGGMFHLVTHAFFKALLFLGAGAIILALHHEQDVRKMGGMWKKMPVLFILFSIGGLALLGMPPFSGFFSKDAVLIGVNLQSQSGLAWQATWWMLLLTVVLTAFYTTRLIILVFFGKCRYEGKIEKTSPTMMIPLIILALLSMAGGLLGSKMNGFLNGATWTQFSAIEGEAYHHAHNAVVIWSVGGLLVGLLAAVGLYIFKRNLLDSFVQGSGKKLHQLAENKFYVDEAYYWGIIAPFKMSASVIWFLVDRILIDTVLVGGTAKLVYWTSGAVRQTHRGEINVGAAAIVIGLLGSLSFLIYRYLHG